MRASFPDIVSLQPDPSVAIAVIDCETDGLGATARVIEFGVAFVGYMGQVISSSSTLLCGDRWVDSKVSALNGITGEMIRLAPKFKMISEWLVELQSRVGLIAHNAAFDQRVLSYEMKRLGQLPVKNMRCSMKLLEELGYGPKVSLSRACQILDVEISPDHSAENDCLATAGVLKRLFERHSSSWDLW